MNNKKFIPVFIIMLQIISCVWYLQPNISHAHVPTGFIKMLIFGSITLILLVLTAILYAIYKPSGLLSKIPFIISIAMHLLAWFYDR